MEVEEISGKLMEVEENLEGSLSSHKRVTSSESDQPLGNGRSSLRSELVSITMLISYEVVMIKHCEIHTFKSERFAYSAFKLQKIVGKCVNLDGIILRQKCENHSDSKNFVSRGQFYEEYTMFIYLYI